MVAKFVDLNIFLDRDGYLSGRKRWVTFVFLSAIMHRMSIFFPLFSAILMRSRNFATVTTSSLYKLTQVKGSHTSISHSLPCGAHGRANGRMVTWLPEFLGCTDNQILLLMVLRERALLKTVHRPWTILIILLKQHQLKWSVSKLHLILDWVIYAFATQKV